jgi:EmrB/QacA subfamily drug resistance transporter
MRRYFVFFIASAALLLSSMTATAVAVAFPNMVTDLHTSIVWAGWALTIYQLVQIGMMPVAGKASDAFGRKRVFIASVGLFCIGSLAASVAPNIPLLLIARVVQATGGSGFMPSAAGIIADNYPESRAKMIGLFSSIFPIGQIVGPNVGGLLVQSLGWRSVFWLPLPLAGVILLASALLFPKNAPGAKSKLDLQGAALLAGGVALVLLALSQLGGGFTAGDLALFGLFAVLGGFFLVRFIKRERHATDPIIDLTLLQSRPFLAANAYNILFGVCVASVSALIPLYAVKVYGLSTVASGFVLTPRSIAIMAASSGTSFLLARWGYRRPMLIGTVILAFCFTVLGFEIKHVTLGGFNLGSSGLLLVMMFMVGLGLGVANPASNNACIELMPNKVASIVGLRGMFRHIGGASGIAVSTVILHLSSSYEQGFRIVFFSFFAIMICAIPLIFMVPSGVAAKKTVVDEVPAKVEPARAAD